MKLDLNAFEKAHRPHHTGAGHLRAGLRASAPIAEFFVHYLKYIFTNVTVVTSGISDVFEQLSRIGEDDLLIGISLPPLHIAHHRGHGIRALSRGASLIAITDGPLSPLHSTADVCLMAKSDMASFVDSFAAPLSLINALIVALSQRRRQEVSEHFAELEKIWANYDVYLAKSGE